LTAAGSLANQTLVLKLGGSVGKEDTLPEDVAQLQQAGARVVIVHGGGPLITHWLERTGLESRFINGLRYTDDSALDIVRMVLPGLVNGEVVARIGAAGGRAVGLSGADDGLLQARVKDPELGRVGEVHTVNRRPVDVLLDAGYVVVVAPVALDADGTFLNVNADTVAGEVAVALNADRLVFLTDVVGLLEDGKVISHLTANQAEPLIARGVVTGGFVPKLEACLRATSGGRTAQIIDGRVPHIVLDALQSLNAVGTTVSGSDRT
jgi:acetylglutamate kinase